MGIYAKRGTNNKLSDQTKLQRFIRFLFPDIKEALLRRFIFPRQ